MNDWTSKPGEPGIYLYSSAKKNHRMPLTWDGKHLWVTLPAGTLVYGRTAILFRPAGGLFWRVPDPPPVDAHRAALAEAIHVAGGIIDTAQAQAALFRGDIGNGATFEIRKAPPEPERPVMPLIKVVTVPGMPADRVIAIGANGELVGAIVNVTISEDPPTISGRWGWKRPPDAT